MGQERSNGIGYLAAVIDGRMRERQDTPLVLDLAEVLGDGILPDTFKKVIPLRDCMACKGAGGGSQPQISPGDRVLIGWVQDGVVVIDVIARAPDIIKR